jgi:uncharacterized protein YrrD
MTTTPILLPFDILKGSTLNASDGEIGKVREFYFDDNQWVVRYFVVETGSWLTGRKVLIAPHALNNIDPQGGSISVALTQEQVRTAPPIETDKPVSRQYEERLNQHYDWVPHWVVPGAVGGMMLSRLRHDPSPETSEVAQPKAAVESSKAKGDPHLRSSEKLQSGYAIHAQDGEIGRVKDFIVDDTDWHVRYLVVHTGVWFLGKDVLLAPEWIERISHERAEVFVNLPRSAIKDAPDYDSAVPLTHAFEERLHDHYGRKGYWDALEASRTA